MRFLSPPEVTVFDIERAPAPKTAESDAPAADPLPKSGG
jgi:hypothetical protein